MEVSTNSVHSFCLNAEGFLHGLKGAKVSDQDVGDDLLTGRRLPSLAHQLRQHVRFTERYDFVGFVDGSASFGCFTP